MNTNKDMNNTLSLFLVIQNSTSFRRKYKDIKHDFWQTQWSGGSFRLVCRDMACSFELYRWQFSASI